VDAQIIGTNLSLRFQPFVQPVLTEFFSLCYFLFFIFLLLSFVYYGAGEIGLLKKFTSGLFTLYGVGFIGYTLLPAAGPWVALAGQFETPLTGWAVTRLNDAVVRAGSNGVDVFPSLHCAVSTYLLFFDRWHRRWRYRLYLVPCVGLWISTIYLRYHYFIDCVCGFALAAAALWLVKPRRTK
jgi:membrane-associated phospholipid phosphatase